MKFSIFRDEGTEDNVSKQRGSIQNSAFGSRLITTALEIKNLRDHDAMVRAFSSGEPINEYVSPYHCLTMLLKSNPAILNEKAVIQDRVIDYKTFQKEMNALAAFLRKRWKLQRQEIVSVCAAGSIEGLVAFFALNKLGAVNARIFNGVKEDKMRTNLLNFNSTVILTDEYNLPVLSRVVRETAIRRVLVMSDCDDEMIRAFWSEHPNLQILTYREAIRQGEELGDVGCEARTAREDLASILYTSGSSGEPKPISIPNRVYTNMVDIVCRTTNIQKCDGERVVSVVSHEYPYAAINCTVMVLLMGKTLIMPKHNNDGKLDFRELLSEKPHRIQAIPNFYKLLQADGEAGILTERDFASFNSLISGGERYLDSEKRELLQFLAARKSKPLLIDGFGFGELGSATALKFGMSPYFLLMNGIRAKAIDPETKEDLPVDQEGILCFSGPTIADGYFNNEKATAESFVKDENGTLWFRSDTYGLVHGKKKRLVQLGGRIREYFITNDGHGNFVKVYAGTVEDVITGSGIVADCIVVPSDGGAMPSPVAYVVLSPDCKLEQEQAKRAIQECCKSLEQFAQPSRINVVEQIQRTRAGKKDYGFYRNYKTGRQ